MTEPLCKAPPAHRWIKIAGGWGSTWKVHQCTVCNMLRVDTEFTEQFFEPLGEAVRVRGFVNDPCPGA